MPRESRFDYLVKQIMYDNDELMPMDLTAEEKKYFQDVDLTEVLFI